MTTDNATGDRDHVGPLRRWRYDRTPARQFEFSSPGPGHQRVSLSLRRSIVVHLRIGLPSSGTVVADPPLADGPHTFEVAATDARNQVDQTPAKVDFVVDTAVRPGAWRRPAAQSGHAHSAGDADQDHHRVAGPDLGQRREDVAQGPDARSASTARARSKCSGRLSITTAEPVSKQQPQARIRARREEVHDRRQQEAQGERQVREAQDAASPSG